MMASTPWARRIEAIVLRTVGDQPSLWESLLPDEVRRLPEELARVDALLDDPVFFAPFVPFFDPRIGRPSTPMEVYLRLMFLKFRYRLGFESLCREVTDSITWRRFCRIPLDGAVPHPTTLMKLTTRCGSAAVEGLNEALLAKAAQAKLLRTTRLRADTTVLPANVSYPTDSGLLAKAVRRIAAAGRRIQAAGGARRTRFRDRCVQPVPGRTGSPPSSGSAARRAARRRSARCGGSPGNLPGSPSAPLLSPAGCWSTPNGRYGGHRSRPPGWPLPVAGTPPRVGFEAGCAERSTTWPSCWMSPGGSARRPVNGWPGPRRTGRRGESACTTPTPVRSPKAASGGPSSSATRPRSWTTTTASSWTTPSSRATRPTRRNSPRLSPASPTARNAARGPSPPTAATASRPSRTTCTTRVYATSSSPERADPARPARPSSTDRRSAAQ